MDRDFVARIARLFSVVPNQPTNYRLEPLFDSEVSEQIGRNREFKFTISQQLGSLFTESLVQYSISPGKRASCVTVAR